MDAVACVEGAPSIRETQRLSGFSIRAKKKMRLSILSKNGARRRVFGARALERPEPPPFESLRPRFRRSTMNRHRKLASVLTIAGLAVGALTLAPTAQAYTIPGSAAVPDQAGCLTEFWNEGVQSCAGTHILYVPLVDNDANTRSPTLNVIAKNDPNDVRCYTQSVSGDGLHGSYASGIAHPNWAAYPAAITPQYNVNMQLGWTLEEICLVNQGSAIVSVVW
jgi:hypothetical protein